MKRILSFLFECEKNVTLTLTVFYFIGYVLGCVFCFLNNVQALDSVLNETYLSVLFKNFILLFIVFIFGYTAFGLPVIGFIVMYSGICNGVIAGSFAYSGGIKGALVSVSVLFFTFFINAICLIYVSFSSMRLSLVVFNSLNQKNRLISPSMYAKPHLIKFLFFTLVIFFTSAYQTIIAERILKLLF